MNPGFTVEMLLKQPSASHFAHLFFREIDMPDQPITNTRFHRSAAGKASAHMVDEIEE